MPWYDIFGGLFTRREEPATKRSRPVQQGMINLQPEQKGTNYHERGLVTQVTPWLRPYDVFRQRWDRKRLVEEVNNRVKSDPRLTRANRKQAQDAIHKGITITVQNAQGRAKAAKVARAAQDVINQVIRDTKMNAKLAGWTRLGLREGELDLNVIVDFRERKIVAINRLPCTTIQRNEDLTGQFPDLERAFTQVDPQHQLVMKDPETGTERHFPLYALNSIRFLHDDGELYGVSQYASTLAHAERLADHEDHMWIRRMVRAGLKIIFSVLRGDGTPADWNDVQKIRDENKEFEDPKKISQAVSQNLWANQQVKAEAIQGDANLHEIADVEFTQDNLWVGAGVPKGLVGYGEHINRDVLEQQQQEYNRDLEYINFLLEHGDGGPYSGLRAIFDFALAIQGINPESVSYILQWTEHTTETKTERAEYVQTLRNMRLIPKRTALHLLSNDLGLESEDDIDALLAELDEETETNTPPQLRGQTPKSEAPPAPGEEEPTEDEAMADDIADDLADLRAKLARKLRDRGRRVWQRVLANPELHPLLDSLVSHGQKHVALNLPVAVVSQTVLHDESVPICGCGHHSDAVLTDAGDLPSAVPLLLMLLKAALNQEDRRRFLQIYLQAARRGGRDAVELINKLRRATGETVKFRGLPGDFATTLRDALETRWDGIDQTTLNHVARETTAAFRSGAERAQWEEAIQQTLAMPQWRADLITDTDLVWAYHQGALQVYQDNGVERLMRNELPTACPECATDNSHIYSADEAGGILPAHGNCYGWWTPVE